MKRKQWNHTWILAILLSLQEASHVKNNAKDLRVGGQLVNVAFAAANMLYERPRWANKSNSEQKAAEVSAEVQQYGLFSYISRLSAWGKS